MPDPNPDSRRRYDRLLRTVAYNTTEAPALPESAARTVLCANAGMEVDDYHRARRAAVENGDLVSGAGYLALPDGELVEAIEYVVSNTDNPRAFVASANLCRDS